MRRTLLSALAVITVVCGAPADAREPVDMEWVPLPPPAPSAPSTPDPAPFVVPAGLYYVTDTYVADVVTTNGTTTTYSTATVHESTGTYARVVDTVGTGSSSSFDGTAFNGRDTLTDGTAVAGTYYENFVLTSQGYVSVSIVFFQDDSETARTTPATPAPTPAATPVPAPPSPVVAVRIPTFAPQVSEREFVPAPSVVSPPPPTISPLRPAPSIAPMMPPFTRTRAGVALTPYGSTLRSVEVLRGRTIQFWPRAFVGDVAVPIANWTLVSGAPEIAPARFGSGAQAFTAQWTRVPSSPVTLAFNVFSYALPGGTALATIQVSVRSPAIID